MKRIFLIICFIITNLIILSAQDYQTVYADRIPYYSNQSGNIKCIRIDSIKYFIDTVYYPFSSIQQLDYDCFTPYGSSWIGKKILFRDNGSNVYFNIKYDTIKIKTNASLYEYWIAYELKDSIKVMATVVKHDTLKFLGIQDSVKTIGFQAYDRTMTQINHSVNNRTILLSKNYGFIKILNFSLFPDYESSFPVEQVEEYYLVGLSNPKLGIQNLAWFDVYDFNIDDELHVFNYYRRVSFEGESYVRTIKTIYKYLDRISYDDSIIYKIEKEESCTERNNTSDPSYSYYHDTIISKINTNILFDKLPGESIYDGSYLYSNIMVNGFWLSKSPRVDLYYFSNDSCWNLFIADGCLYTEYYYKGLGGPYYECESNFADFTSINKELVYYKKGQESWGNPLIITNIPESNKFEALVYPNPTSDIIFIEINYSDENTIFELTDIHGKVINSKHLENAFNEVNVHNFIRGIYFFKILNNQKLIASGKIILK